MRQLWRQGLTRLLFALLVVQGGYWLLFHPAFISPPIPQGVSPLKTGVLHYVRLTEPTWQAVEQAQFRPVEKIPFPMPRGYHASRSTLQLDLVPAEGLALLVADSADNREVWINGSLLAGDGRMRLPDVTFHGQLRKMLRVPSAMLREGGNDVVTIAVSEFSEDGVMVQPIAGPYKAFERAFGWKTFLFGSAQIISLTIGLVMALLIGIVMLRSSQKRFLFWLMVLALCWSLGSLLRIWPNLPLHGPWRTFSFTGSAMLLSLAWPMMIDAWTESSSLRFRQACTAIFTLGFAAITWFNFGDGSDRAFGNAVSVLVWAGLVLLCAAFVRLIWHAFRQRGSIDRPWEAALLITMAMLFALSFSSAIGNAINSFYWQLTQPLFLLLFATAFLGRNFRLFRSQEQINAQLQAELQRRTAELELAHAREKELVRQRAYNDERGRIMRDMHDGLGSNLMSMLLAARRGVAEPAAVAEGLQGVVDEMRLMIDSMDSVGESLGTALATFRGRVADRITGAGFRLEWQDNATRPLPGYAPRTVLQVFRIMQEAVTNALRHSGGDRIAIGIADGQNESEVLVITIADNGRGQLNILNNRGRGLANMHSRAAAIGAAIEFVEKDGGLCVRLGLVARANV